jgi:methionyl-tRNA synthetase
MLGRAGKVTDAGWDAAGAPADAGGRKLAPPAPLFTKIPDEAVAAEVAALHGRAAALQQASELKEREKDVSEQDMPAEPPALPGLRPEIKIDDFLKCDFRLGTILEAERVAGSKKLLKFIVDIGLEKRTILAGIQEHYEPEALVGKTVVVIANLAPRRMMGFDSQGMVLAAEVDGKLTVLTPLSPGLLPGARLS